MANSTNASAIATTPSQRLVSLDAYRGFIMLAMASAGLRIPDVAKHVSGGYWQAAAKQLDHVPWQGCAAWDLIQPAFMFMVGVAIPYSFARRLQEGGSYGRMVVHAASRAAILIILAIFLSTPGHTQTNFVFENVLAQIGLGYVFVFLLCGRGWQTQALTALAILAGTWLLFVAYPVPQPGVDFDYAKYALPHDWPLLSGLTAHWNKHVNVAAQFDLVFLNLFPRDKPFLLQPNDGGYATLNFIPSIATMILGLMAGELLRSARSARSKLFWLVSAGIGLMIVGLILDRTGCPVVKRIWTPSWVFVSGAWVVWMLAAFYAAIDMTGYKCWALPLVIVGMNSIAMYCMSQLMKGWIWSQLQLHFGTLGQWQPIAGLLRLIFGQQGFDLVYMPIVQAGSTLLVMWLICYWMYRQKIFIRI